MCERAKDVLFLCMSILVGREYLTGLKTQQTALGRLLCEMVRSPWLSQNTFCMKLNALSGTGINTADLARLESR